MKLVQLLILVTFFAARAVVAADAAAGDGAEYLRVSIDKVVIDTAGLEAASQNLAASIATLAQSIERLSQAPAGLDESERQALLDAVQSVDAASRALAELALRLPDTASDLGARLPQLIDDARAPIADLSVGLGAARDGLVAVTEALPQATENAKSLVNSALDAALWRLSLYSILLFALLALLLIGVMWFVYRQYLDPLARRLDALVGAPEHFAAMAKYMQQTSANLLALETRGAAEPQASPPAIEADETVAAGSPPDAGENDAEERR